MFSEEAPTPPGWERKKDPKGFIFWVNHAEKKISYTNPGEGTGGGAPPTNYNQYGTDPYSAGFNETEMPTTQV